MQRKRVIQKITKEDGEVTDKEEEIKETFSNCYKQLYSKGKIDRAIQERYSKKTKEITNEMKEAMDRKITKEKIEESISELNKNKTPGPDGIINEFYHHSNRYHSNHLGSSRTSIQKQSFSKTNDSVLHNIDT